MLMTFSQTPGRIQKVDPPEGSRIYTMGVLESRIGGRTSGILLKVWAESYCSAGKCNSKSRSNRNGSHDSNCSAVGTSNGGSRTHHFRIHVELSKNLGTQLLGSLTEGAQNRTSKLWKLPNSLHSREVDRAAALGRSPIHLWPRLLKAWSCR